MPTHSHVNPAHSVVGYTLHGNRYLNVTTRCSLRCAFCPKFNGSWLVKTHNLLMRREPSVEQLVAAAGDVDEFNEVVFCGLGEPTQRIDVVLQVARILKQKGARIRLNTNGQANLFHGRDVTPELAGAIDALCVSLNAQDEATYNKHCRPKQHGAYGALLEFVRRSRHYVPEVTVTAIDGLPGVDIEACHAIADALGVGFRRRILNEVG